MLLASFGPIIQFLHNLLNASVLESVRVTQCVQISQHLLYLLFLLKRIQFAFVKTKNFSMLSFFNFISFPNLCGCQQSHFKEKVNGGFLFPAKKNYITFSFRFV